MDHGGKQTRNRADGDQAFGKQFIRKVALEEAIVMTSIGDHDQRRIVILANQQIVAAGAVELFVYLAEIIRIDVDENSLC